MRRRPPGPRRHAQGTGRSRRPRIEALEGRQLLTTFTVTNATDGGPGSFRQAILDANSDDVPPTAIDFHMTVGSAAEVATTTAASGPFGIVAGPGGALFFAEETADKIGRIDPATGAITEVNVPTAGAQPSEIALGSDNNLYFTEQGGHGIGRLNPTTNVITEFQVPNISLGSTPFAISSGPDGNIWFTDLARRTVDRFVIATSAITETTIPTAGAFSFGITSNPDGHLYFAEGAANQIGRIDATTLAIQEFAAPNDPEGITTGPDGNVWFTAAAAPGSAIGRFDLATTTATEIPTPTANSIPEGITTGPDGALWFTEFGAGKVGRITTAGAITEFTPPTAGSQPLGIATGADGLVWFTEQGASQLGRITTSAATTIRPATALPAVFASVVIDGYTQPGSSPNTLAVGDNAVLNVVLDGSAEPAGTNALDLERAGSTVEGLVIQNFPGLNSPSSVVGGMAIVLGSGGSDVITGNFLGTDATGRIAMGNTNGGVIAISAGNTIGGATPAARNVISGNDDGTGAGVGVFLLNDLASSNVVQGNYIGVDATGAAALPNGNVGIQINDAPDNTIGGTAPGAGNVIGANALGGIDIANPLAAANVVQGNVIGTDPSLAVNLGNGSEGIGLFGVSDVTIGGTAPGQGNTIAFTAGKGVIVADGTGTAVRDAILGNSIFGNTGLGIDLGDDGVTPNTPGGPHAGANDLQNFPVLATAYPEAGGTTVNGSFNSTPAATFRLEFFASATPDATGFGQGRTFLGAISVTTDAAGNATFHAPGLFATALPYITATATITAAVNPSISTGDTSEFSAAITQGFVVINTNDAGPGSLRQAILNSNAAPGTDTVTFAIPGAGVHTIALASALPPTTDPVVIAGDTQPGFAGTPLVALDGTKAGANVDGLFLQGGASTVRGLSIGDFNRYGIRITNLGGDVIQGDYIGLAPDGVTARPNLNGVTAAAPGNTIGGTAAGAGNVLGGNSQFQVELDASGNVIQGNRIGTNAAGTAAAGGTAPGVSQLGIALLNSGANTIGGTTVAARNLISGNAGSAIGIRGLPSAGNLIQGNFIGTDVTGTAAVPNRGASAIFIFTDASANTVGGTAPGAGNVISGNGGIGVFIGEDRLGHSATAANVIQGNRIGTNAAGTAALANGGPGVEITGPLFAVTGNTIGGTAPGAGNLISGNAGEGVVITGGTARGNLVEGNRIGTDAAGVAAIPNLSGVRIEAGATFNTVGGAGAGAGNLISGNTAFGVLITDLGTSSNFVQANTIGPNVVQTAALGNGYGVGIVNAASGEVVGGVTAALGNLISGNVNDGIFLDDAADNMVLDNRIGTDAAGIAALAPAATTTAGVELNDGASGNVVGGNLISGVAGAGVLIRGTSTVTGNTLSNRNVIAGNRIGTDATGLNPVPDGGAGVLVNAGAFLNTIGGTAPGAGNVIAFNRNAGVYVESGAGNGILGNSIFSNAALGIDLAPPGVTPNSPEPHAGGPNFNQNFPVLTSVINAGATTAIAGTLDGVAGSAYRIEVFASVAADPSGFGQGRTYLGSVTVTAGADGVAAFQFSAPATLAGPGRSITSTATLLTPTSTDPGDDTSEFSRAVAVGGFTVLNTNDSGFGSLRQAILDVNASGRPGITIDFKIPGAAPHNINILSQLPFVNVRDTVINAATQPGFAGRPVVAVDGASAGLGANGLDLNAAGITVRGLAIHGFRADLAGNGGNGVVLEAGAGGDVLAGDDLGTDTTGTGGAGNAGVGVLVLRSPGNTIGGAGAQDANVVSNNGGAGVEITGFASFGNVVQGDLIGTDLTGGLALGNAGAGVFLNGAPNNRIGAAGTTRNVISGNRGAGVEISGVAATGNVLQGDLVGTDLAGSRALGNGGAGVFIVGAPNNRIGGAGGPGNVISGNAGPGVEIAGSAAAGNVLQGDLIGTDVTGERALGNLDVGVSIVGAPGNRIGVAGGPRNVISGNAGPGVEIAGLAASGNVIANDSIGLDGRGVGAVGNGSIGVFIDGAPGNLVGGTTAAGRNVISGNRAVSPPPTNTDPNRVGAGGVVVIGAGARNNRIQGNFIGTNAAGNGAVGNAFDGVDLSGAPANTVGGTASGAMNVISSNKVVGVRLFGAGATGDLVQGNRIGTNLAGTAKLGNAQGGVFVEDAPATPSAARPRAPGTWSRATAPSASRSSARRPGPT